MIDLQKYCGNDGVRMYLQKPFRIMLNMVATNGHILVAVPYDGRDLDNDGPPYKVINRIKDWLTEPHASWLPLVIDIPEEKSCEWCDGECVVDTEDSEDCRCSWCEGTGKNQKESVQLFDCHIARRYAVMLAELPNVRVHTSGPEGRVDFLFDGGRGCVMPLRM